MTKWGWFLATPPWEKMMNRSKEKVGPIERTSVSSASTAPLTKEDALYQALLPISRKLPRGRPRKKLLENLDCQRAIVVEIALTATTGLGQNLSRRKVIFMIQSLAAEGPDMDHLISLFRHGDLEASVSRGMKQLEILRAEVLRNDDEKTCE